MEISTIGDNFELTSVSVFCHCRANWSVRITNEQLPPSLKWSASPTSLVALDSGDRRGWRPPPPPRVKLTVFVESVECLVSLVVNGQRYRQAEQCLLKPYRKARDRSKLSLCLMYMAVADVVMQTRYRAKYIL